MAALKGKITVSGALAAATCTLLGTSAVEPVQAQEDPGWDVNTSLLYYGEGDGRVQDLSFESLFRRSYIDDRYLTLGLTVDALTGATPTGALPQPFAQTFTSPSGRGVVTIRPGDFPMDNSFHDTRVAASADWQQPLGRLVTVSAGANASVETDYLHLGVNGKLSRDFNNRNTTLSAGLALAADQVSAIGGIPDPLTLKTETRTGGGGEGEGEGEGRGLGSGKSKQVVDLVFGVTQVISRNFLVQMNYSFSDSSGYLNDPYKVLSLVDPVTGEAIPSTPLPGVLGPSYQNFYENRPDTRKKQSLYTQGKLYMNGKVLDASYRYMSDDWNIKSHTMELRLRIPSGDSSYLEPHLRYYSQSAADFYRTSLVDGEPLPEFASADYRLGSFDAMTAGIKFGWETLGGNEASLRLEYYGQKGNVSRADLIGTQADRPVYPDLNAVILQYSYRFGR